MPLDLAHTCHGSTPQMTSWLTCSQNIIHPKSSPHMTIASLPTKYVSDLKVV